MAEPKIIFEFNCPNPQCVATRPDIKNKTVTEVACEPLRESGKIDEGQHISMTKVAVPLIDMTRVTGLTIPIMFVEKDVCAECGTE